MTDIATIWDVDTGYGDWQQDGAQLASGDDLVTAVLISLFTDRVAAVDDQILDGSGDPRGWWGDAGADAPIGSRLWQLERAKQTTDTLRRAQAYVTEALQWLIDDDVVASFDLTVEWTQAGMLGIHIIAYKNDGTREAMNFAWAWQGIQ